MAIAAGANTPRSEPKLFRLCPFWTSANASSPSPSSSVQNNHNHRSEGNNTVTSASSSKTVSAVARSLLPPRRRLRLDPSSCLYFPYEPGKQVRSAVRLKNTSKSYVAFKFQTTAPKSCYMRPPGGIIAPGESLFATVFKFVEQPENNEKMSDQKNKVKFKIMSLKVKQGVDYVPELFDEQKDLVSVERILKVVFIDPERPSLVSQNYLCCETHLSIVLMCNGNSKLVFLGFGKTEETAY
ncbi:Vesicle-associated protein 4-1, variant 2 [Stylosanthes scabra]|uniref:Vesicle-associated protein 4-1, variant 2 n=1 Tax=Stylosanthes scabra TaxID=79078 RepID=A0ABU6V709_9FABA|nr:Vesicle-associated protein 4-1, variant 2 [Stylosanthes scabra]